MTEPSKCDHIMMAYKDKMVCHKCGECDEEGCTQCGTHLTEPASEPPVKVYDGGYRPTRDDEIEALARDICVSSQAHDAPFSMRESLKRSEVHIKERDEWRAGRVSND